jgi:glutaconyl-CoA/methylmalonyl-CoA decarboxylase subunit gamma
MEELKVKIDGKEHLVKIEEGLNELKVHLDGKVYGVQTSLKKEQDDYEFNTDSKKEDNGEIKANIPGLIFSVDIKKDQKVKKGQKLISLIAMKMENQIMSPKEGTVKEVKVKKNDKVNKGDVLLIIS